MKLFRRMGAEKVTCTIELKISSFEVDVEQPLVLKLRWTRGPQQDVSETFEVNRDRNTYELNFFFSRQSTFYKDGKGGYQRKDCSIDLIYTSVGREEVAGTVEIDMGPFVGRGAQYQAFQLREQSVTRKAQVNAFFNIYEENEVGNTGKLSGSRSSLVMNQ